MRPRKKDRHLPPCVFLKHGAYWLVKRGKWIRLAADLPTALAEFARLSAQPRNGMAALIEDALPHIIQGKADSTAKKYRGTARYLQVLLKDFAPEQVTQRDVVAIRRELKEQASVCNRTLNVLKLVFDYALEEGLLDSNPCVGVKTIPPNKRQRAMSFAEFEAIKAQAGPLLQVIMDLCYLTGQRIGDVLKIKRADLTESGIYIEQKKSQGNVRLFVAWNDDLRATVERAKSLHGTTPSLYLLKGTRGKPPAYATIWKQYDKARRLAGIEDVIIHDLRAKSGTEAQEQGIDPQKLLGHTNPEMTKRYLRARKIPVVEGPSFRQSNILKTKAQ